MFIAIELVKRTWRVGYIRAYNRIEDEHDLNNHSMNQVYNYAVERGYLFRDKDGLVKLTEAGTRKARMHYA